MVKQVERAGTSVMHDIAEGSHRAGGDQRRFYVMAQGSAAEIRAALDTSEAWGWKVDTSKARPLLDRQLALLWGSPADATVPEKRGRCPRRADGTRERDVPARKRTVPAGRTRVRGYSTRASPSGVAVGFALEDAGPPQVEQ